MKSNKIETLVECSEIAIINMAEDIKTTATMLRDECEKTSTNKDVLRALFKDLKEITETYLIDKDDKSQLNETKDKVSKPELVVSIKLEGTDEVMQQLKDIETQLTKINECSKQLNQIRQENITVNITKEQNLNEIVEEAIKQINGRVKSYAIRMNGNL